MAVIIQHRRDTFENWIKADEKKKQESIDGLGGLVLAWGEIGFIAPDPTNTNPDYRFTNSSLYKIGDGVTVWRELPIFGWNGNLSNNLSDGVNDANEVVSKEALLHEFNHIWDTIGEFDIENGTITEQINLSQDDIRVLQEFANINGPVIQQLSETSKNHTTSIDKHEKELYDWNEIQFETDGNGNEFEIIIPHVGLTTRVEDLEKYNTESEAYVTEEEFKTLRDNQLLVDGVKYYTYVPKNDEEIN